MRRSEVIEACTVGVPDKMYGEEVVAYVVLRPGVSIGADDILRHCAAALPAFKTPKQIVLSDELPKTERGKLDRKPDMKLKDEPNNWLGLALILVLILVFALVIHWAGLPKSPA